MGQGLYSGIGFGCILEDIERWLENNDRLSIKPLKQQVEEHLGTLRDALSDEGIDLQMAEEAKPDYLIIPLATTERMRVRHGRVEQLPMYCPIPFDQLVSTWLAVISSERLDEARQNWERLRRSAAALGVSVPEGKLIYISDWD